MIETFDMVGRHKKHKTSATLAVQDNEWFISPAPFHFLIALCDGMRMFQMSIKKGRKKSTFVSWSDAKKTASDAMTPELIEAVDGLIARCDAARKKDPLQGVGDERTYELPATAKASS